jgi:hypothetical protein
MSTAGAGPAAVHLSGSRRSFARKFATRGLATALLILAAYVANYWALHWLQYRGWMSASGLDRILSRACRTPGDWYATSDLPGAPTFDHWKREWQRSGARARERAWQAEVAERERQAIIDVLEAQRLRHLEQRRVRAGTTIETGTTPTGESHVASGR